MRHGVIGLTLLALVGGATAAPATHTAAAAQALGLGEQAIALRSVRGSGNKTPAVAALYKAALVAGGWADGDVVVTPVDDTAYLIATWPGTNPALKPLVISGHMDVVEANPADWRRDPFTPVVEDGYLFGRGATDMKLDGTTALAALIELRRAGYRPHRTIVIEFSGDEETVMKTSALIADKLKGADLVLNIDGGGGVLDERTGKPLYWTWQGAEKTYADFELTVTNPGGHSSAPRRDNAIVQLATALTRIGAYHFKPEINDLTRAYFMQAAKYEKPTTASAMRDFAADPTDHAAIATLTADYEMVGEIGTTCVVTMLGGGHALNALPQRATANINCRIFPGHAPAEIMAELKRVAAEPAVTFKDVTAGAVPNDASPGRPDFVAAVTRGLATESTRRESTHQLAVNDARAVGHRDCTVVKNRSGKLSAVTQIGRQTAADSFSALPPDFFAPVRRAMNAGALARRAAAVRSVSATPRRRRAVPRRRRAKAGGLP